MLYYNRDPKRDHSFDNHPYSSSYILVPNPVFCRSYKVVVYKGSFKSSFFQERGSFMLVVLHVPEELLACA